MSKKDREIWSCGRMNRKFRGENLNANYSRYERRKEDLRRFQNLPRHLQKLIWHSEVRDTIEEIEVERIEAELELWGWFCDDNAPATDEMTRFDLLCAVDPEFKRKVNDPYYAKACECGAVCFDRYGRVRDFNHLPNSIRRENRKIRRAKREAALREIAC